MHASTFISEQSEHLVLSLDCISTWFCFHFKLKRIVICTVTLIQNGSYCDTGFEPQPALCVSPLLLQRLRPHHDITAHAHDVIRGKQCARLLLQSLRPHHDITAHAHDVIRGKQCARLLLQRLRPHHDITAHAHDVIRGKQRAVDYKNTEKRAVSSWVSQDS